MDDTEICDIYHTTQSIAETARQSGKSEKVIGRVLRENNIIVKRGLRGRDEEVLEMYLAGMTRTDIAHHFEVKIETVTGLLERNGIKYHKVNLSEARREFNKQDHTNKLCQYGCGQPALFVFPPSRKVKTGRVTCADTSLKCPAVIARREKSNIKKYGVANPLELVNADTSDEATSKRKLARAKAMATFEERYGVRGAFGIEEVRRKSLDTLKQRYGVSNANQVPGSTERAGNTMIERYGRTVKNNMPQFQKSKIGSQWLDSLGVTQREVWLEAGGKRFKVDGMRDETIYEFYGNYWHGNPRLYSPDFMNHQAKKTMGELYENTLLREELIRNAGYELITIWEDEYRKMGR